MFISRCREIHGFNRSYKTPKSLRRNVLPPQQTIPQKSRLEPSLSLQINFDLIIYIYPINTITIAMANLSNFPNRFPQRKDVVSIFRLHRILWNQDVCLAREPKFARLSYEQNRMESCRGNYNGILKLVEMSSIR